MHDNNHVLIDLDELDLDLELDDSPANKRVSVRYRRNDIRVTLTVRGFIFKKEWPVELLDISSKGAAIRCDKKLKLKQRTCLFVQFTDQKCFAIDAVVAHNHSAPRYGLKFDRYQGELGEHLLETQTNLEFS